MKKIISYILITVILTLLLSGCGANSEESWNTGDLEDQEELVNSESALDALAISELAGKDNSLDAYSAAVNVPLRVEEPEKAIEGGGSKLFLGSSRAYFFKKHLLENAEEDWDELAFANAEGEKDSASFDRENKIWDIGPVCGTDHYVTLGYALQEGEDKYRYFLLERDENHEVLREFPLDFLNGNTLSEVVGSLSSLAVDYFGAVHLVRYMGGEWCYQIVSPEGEVKAEYSPKGGSIQRLVPLYDGRVALWVTDQQTGGKQLQYMDLEQGRAVTLATLDKNAYYVTLLDENTLLYADRDGVYCSNLSGDDIEVLYLWINHGILLSGVSSVQADEERRIALIYEGFGGMNYLRLEPTTEEVETRKITLAVNLDNMSFYQTAAAVFNRQYPSCYIEIKSNYDKTTLLTELTAGNGPVLIDTSLTGFEEQEKLWEPLDTVMEQLGVTEELQPSVLELGKVNGILYGVVMDIRLKTLLTGDPDLKNWDYDTFLQCIEDRPELEAIFNCYSGDYGTYFITSFLSHGLEDSYLLDAESGMTNFDSSGFRRALELAKKYCVRDDAVNPGSSVLEGRVLCHELYISRPEEIALCRICYGEDANYIGFPAKDGATHFITGSSPLAIRRTATKEEKEIACAFLKQCLSYESQSGATKDVNFALSVRKDVLEEQIAAMDERTAPFITGLGQIELGDDLNIELDGKILHELIDKARPQRSFPPELRNVLFEELEQYFANVITEDMLIEHLESRVGLYLDERN